MFGRAELPDARSGRCSESVQREEAFRKRREVDTENHVVNGGEDRAADGSG